MATKSDLLEYLSQKLDFISYEDVKWSVDFILDYIQTELAKGNRIEIRNFGSLSIRKRKYADKDEYYNAMYYRMSKNVLDISESVSNKVYHDENPAQ